MQGCSIWTAPFYANLNRNNLFNDDRIWQVNTYYEQSTQVWKDLATRLRDPPVVVGYNFVNEPGL